MSNPMMSTRKVNFGLNEYVVTNNNRRMKRPTNEKGEMTPHEQYLTDVKTTHTIPWSPCPIIDDGGKVMVVKEADAHH